jgi:hypothetical protein
MGGFHFDSVPSASTRSDLVVIARCQVRDTSPCEDEGS